MNEFLDTLGKCVNWSDLWGALFIWGLHAYFKIVLPMVDHFKESKKAKNYRKSIDFLEDVANTAVVKAAQHKRFSNSERKALAVDYTTKVHKASPYVDLLADQINSVVEKKYQNIKDTVLNNHKLSKDENDKYEEIKEQHNTEDIQEDTPDLNDESNDKEDDSVAVDFNNLDKYSKEDLEDIVKRLK